MTAGTEIMRQSNKVARSLISVQSRLNQIIDEESSTGKKLTAWYEEHNIAIYNQEGQIRSLYEILTDVNKIWKDLDKNEQAYYLNIQAGANQTASLAAILSNFNTALDATATAYDSAGSAAKENERFMESLSAQLQQLKSAWEAFSNSVVNSDLVKFFIGAGTNILKVLNTDLGVLISQFGLLTGVGTGAVALLGMFGKNLTAAIPSLAGFASTMDKVIALSPVLAAGLSIVVITIGRIASEVGKSIEATREYWAQVNQSANNLKNTYEEAEEAVVKNLDAIEGTSIYVSKYVDRLDELNQKLKDNKDATQLTRAEEIELQNIIDILNEKIPNLNLHIEETTGKLSTQTDKIREQIKEWKNLSEVEAYRAEAQQKKDVYESTQEDLDTYKATLKRLETEQSALLAQYGDIIAATPTSDIGFISDWLERIYGIPKEAVEKWKEVNVEINKTKDSITKTTEALEKYKWEYDFSLSTAKFYESQEPKTTRFNRERSKTASLLPTYDDSKGKIDYDAYLKRQKHYLNLGLINEKQYYSELEAILNIFTDQSIISTEERWKAEEDIFKYKQNLTKEQQQAYEKAVRDAKSAAKEKAQAEKQAISDVKTEFTAWQDEQDYLLTTGQITEVEYYDNLRAKNDELFKDKEDFQSQYWTNLEKIYKWEQQQIEDQKKAKVTEFDEWLKAQDHALAMGEISEEEYYTELKKKNDEYFKDSTENLDKYWKNEESWYKWKKQKIEEIHEAAKAALDAEIEKEKQRLELKKTEAETRKAQLEAQQDEIERLADYVQTVADAEIGKIDEKISALKDEADAITAKYKEQIDALEQQNQAIDDQITKQKLLEALAKAQQNKKYVFKDGRFQYVDDVDAIASAQEQLDEFNREQALQEKTKQLEKQRDLELEQNRAAQQALEDEKKRWEEYKQGWSNITNAYTEQQNALLAQQKLGIDVEKATWDERLNNLENFKNQYISLAAQIKAAEAEIAGYDAQIASVGSAENQDAAIRRMMKENSEAWHQTSDVSEREKLHEMNEYLNSLLSNKGTYNAASGQWSNLSYPSQVALPSGSANSVLTGAPPTTPSALPSRVVNDKISGVKRVLSQIFNMGNISLPNVSNAKQFVSELKNMALQAAYSRA